jgi:hypothetical protein
MSTPEVPLIKGKEGEATGGRAVFRGLSWTGSAKLNGQLPALRDRCHFAPPPLVRGMFSPTQLAKYMALAMQQKN